MEPNEIPVGALQEHVQVLKDLLRGVGTSPFDQNERNELENQITATEIQISQTLFRQHQGNHNSIPANSSNNPHMPLAVPRWPFTTLGPLFDSDSSNSGGVIINGSSNVGMKRNREEEYSDHFHPEFPETKSQRTTPSPIAPAALPTPSYVGVGRTSPLSRHTGIRFVTSLIFIISAVHPLPPPFLFCENNYFPSFEIFFLSFFFLLDLEVLLEGWRWGGGGNLHVPLCSLVY